MTLKGSCMVLLIFLASACGGKSPSPAAPSAPGAAPTPVGPPFSVSGTIFEHTVTGRRPLAGFHFTVTGSGVSASPLTVDVTSDADGRYEATGFPSRAHITVSHAGYRAPCPQYTVLVLNSNSILNLDVVSDATLASTGIPQSLPTHFPLTISGTVSETVQAGGGAVGGVALESFLRPADIRKRARAGEHAVGCRRPLPRLRASSGRDRPGVLDTRPQEWIPARYSIGPGCGCRTAQFRASAVRLSTPRGQIPTAAFENEINISQREGAHEPVSTVVYRLSLVCKTP